MKQTITEANIKAVVQRLNDATSSPREPYVQVDGKHEPQALCWHIGYAYGGYQLQRMSGTPGRTGVSSYGGYGTKRELWDRVHAMLEEIRAISE